MSTGLRTVLALAPFSLLIFVLLALDAWKSDRHQAELDRLAELPPALTAPRPLRHDQYLSARERERRAGERRRAQR